MFTEICVVLAFVEYLLIKRDASVMNNEINVLKELIENKKVVVYGQSYGGVQPYNYRSMK